MGQNGQVRRHDPGDGSERSKVYVHTGLEKYPQPLLEP